MSPTGLLVVARLRNGEIIRGYSSDFQPGRMQFSVWPSSGATVRVIVSDLKAVFFVKSLTGDSRHVQDTRPSGLPEGARRTLVVFSDGEVLAGHIRSQEPDEGGFFLFPNDVKGNLERAWIVEQSTKRVLYDEEAEEALRNHVQKGPPPSVDRISFDDWDDTPAMPSSPDFPAPVERPDRRHDSPDPFLGEW